MGVTLDDIVAHGSGYWDFRGNILAFGQSLAYSHLDVLETDAGPAYIRRANALVTVLTVPDGAQLDEPLERLCAQGVTKVRFMAARHAPYPHDRETHYLATADWQPSRRRLKYTQSAGLEFHPVPRTEDGVARSIDLIERWRVRAQARHFMVTVGHYKAVAKLHLEIPESHMFWATKNGAIVGLIGGYIAGSAAVVVNAKQDYTVPYASEAMWVFWLRYALEHGAAIVHCGDTADEFKQKLHLAPERIAKMRTLKLVTADARGDTLIG